MTILKCKRRSLGFSLLELLVVLIVISILIYSGFGVYVKQINNARMKTLEFQANSFSRMVANIHAFGSGTQNRKVNLLKKHIYLNERYYPSNTFSYEYSSFKNQTEGGCMQLWKAFFETVGKNSNEKNINGFPLVTVKNNSICRYDVFPKQAGTYFFDYHFKTGKVFVGQLESF